MINDGHYTSFLIIAVTNIIYDNYYYLLLRLNFVYLYINYNIIFTFYRNQTSIIC